jgi:tRNA threonylcarbamoyl adenosine modification protein YeaZ
MLLAIDTSLSSVSLCLQYEQSNEPIARSVVKMQRGHAEMVMPLLQDLFDGHHIKITNLTKIAVTVGPGSYTGMRIGIAVAKTMGVVLDIPVVGVSTLAALAAPLLSRETEKSIIAVIDARNDNIYQQKMGGSQLVGPSVINKKQFFEENNDRELIFVGPAAQEMAQLASCYGRQADYLSDSEICDITYVARLGWLAQPSTAPARPLYLNTPQYKRLITS